MGDADLKYGDFVSFEEHGRTFYGTIVNMPHRSICAVRTMDGVVWSKNIWELMLESDATYAKEVLAHAIEN